jgi:HNH endonuclease
MGRQSEFHHLYNSVRWRRMAAHQLRLEPLCQYCAERGQVEPARVADHITQHHGNVNAFWLGPLQSLCFSCHDRTKRDEERKGYRHDAGPDGWPTDPRHPVNRKQISRDDRKAHTSGDGQKILEAFFNRSQTWAKNQGRGGR